MEKRPLQNQCLWIQRPSWENLETRPNVRDVREKFLRPKKWSQPPAGTIVTVSVAAFAASLSIRPPFATALTTRFIVESVMVDLGNHSTKSIFNANGLFLFEYLRYKIDYSYPIFDIFSEEVPNPGFWMPPL